MNNNDRRIASHTLLDTTRTYRADKPAYDPSKDTEPGTLVLGNGMEVRVIAAFYDWNGVKGLDMLYVFCPQTSMSTHVTPADLGWIEPLQDELQPELTA